MEDGLTEVQSLLPHLNHHSSEDGSKREDIEENEEGFVSTEKIENDIKEKDLGIDEAKEVNDGGEGGGVINNLISTFMTPLSPRTGKPNFQHESGNEVFEKDEEVDHNNGKEKGLISNLVSNFFHRSEKENEDEEIIVDEKIKRLKTEHEDNSGGGGFIHDIVSHLHSPLSDDAAPTADEATILINSLVRD
uniref:Uncharacterized protein LOC101501670 n=2 Tax=Cicer arietinum TaxID=3827 RepID=A0A1S2XQP8_CICAR|nr:uncharacterized protein LOC101501670 [Cicer arietinum]